MFFTHYNPEQLSFSPYAAYPSIYSSTSNVKDKNLFVIENSKICTYYDQVTFVIFSAECN